MESSPSMGSLALALATAQRTMPNAKRESKNPFYKSMYADLASVVSAIGPSLAENKIALMQFVEHGQDKGTVAVTTMLVHESGEWVKATLTVTPAKADPQEIGKAITYLRRYGALAIVGRAAEEDDDDDDGNADSKPERQAEEEQTQELITEEQAQELDAMRVDADITLEQFKKYFGIVGRPIAALPATSYEKARDMLKRALAKKSKR